MKKSQLIILLPAIFLSGCAASTPEPTSTPRPAPTQTSTPIPQLNTQPDMILEISNTADAFSDPYGLAINSAGNIYVNDAGKSRVKIFDNAGNFLSKWDAKGSGEGEFNSLGFGGLAIDGNDNVFVVDNGNFRIQKFDSQGKFITQWGSEGKEDGQFTRAIGIAVDKDGNVYAVSYTHLTLPTKRIV